MRIYYFFFLLIVFLGMNKYSNAQLSGTYTIDSSSTTSGTNFQSFADLRSTLSSQGVSGAVIVNVALGSGPYNERVIFDGYSGLSSSNTITINGNGERINFNPSPGLSDKRIIGFDSGSKYFILDSLYITGNYGFGVGFDDDTEYITVRNCTIKMSNTGNWFQCAAIGSTNCPRPAFSCTQGSNASNITIENNTILGSTNSGSFNAIYFVNEYSSRAVNNTIRNNTISGFVGRGIYATNQDSLVIENNKISKPLRKISGASYGISYRSDTLTRGVRIVRNEIFNLNGGKIGYTSSGTYGIDIDASGSNNYPIKVQNNVIYELNRSIGSVYGIQTKSNRYIEITNNSILLDDQVAASSAITIGIFLKKAKSHQKIINNIIRISRKNFGSNYGISIEDSLTNSVVDYNNISLSSKNANNYYGRIGSIKFKEILDWNSFNFGVFGINSFSQDPLYISNNNLTPRAEFLNNSALNNGLKNDFFSALRDSTPDIGAIEFDCGVPTLSFETLSDTSISLSLSFIGDSLRNWEIKYDTISFAPDSGVNRVFLSTWDTTINNLIFNKNYCFYIRSICSVSDTGYWSNKYFFKTTGRPLAGKYTIDSSQVTAGNNFQSFSDLTYRLEISGISDSVIVDVVKGSGPYNQKVIFKSIIGLDSLTPLIINGNSETLMFTPNTSDYRILGFDNAKYITIDSLTVKNLHQNHGYNIHFKNNSNHITIKNSIIDFSSITHPYSNSVGIFANNSGSSNTSHLKILNNAVKGNTTNGVSSGILLQGGNSSEGNEISGNSIQNFTTNGIFVDNQKNLVIKGNIISNNVISYPSVSGININGGNSKNVVIEENQVENLSLPNASYNNFVCGIKVSSNVSSLQNPIIVRNNIIKEIFSDRDLSGVRINGSGFFQIYHNTLYLNDTINNQGNLSGLYYETNAGAPEVYNNVISLNKGGGGNTYSYFFKGSANSTKSGNNSFHFGKSGSGKNYVCRKSVNYSVVLHETLLDWQNSGSIKYDVNTVIENPEFESDSILRPTNFVLKSGGVNLGVSKDFFGTSRDNTPDIGAINLDTFNYPYYPIQRIVSTDSSGILDSLNIYCKTSGTVASVDFNGGKGKEFYIIDLQRGIQNGIAVISEKNISNYSVKPGDSVEVSGQISQHNGQTFIDPLDIEFLSDSSEMIISKKVDFLLDSLESTLVKLENLKLLVRNDSSDYLLSTTNRNNDTIYIRIDSDTDINDSLNIAGFAIGDSICSIVGIVSQYDTASPFNSGYRLLPNYFSEIDTITCVQTDFELAQKDTLIFDLNNCTDSVFFKYTLQNLSSSLLNWKTYTQNDTLKDDFESNLKLFWNKSVGVSIDSACESVNGTNALTFKGKNGLRFIESHPISFTCKNNIKLNVKKADFCDSTSYSTANYLRLQCSYNYGVTWKTIKTITTSGDYDVPLIDTIGLLKFRIVQFASSTATSQIWMVDDFSIEPNLNCRESISYLKSSSTILPTNNYDLSGFISTQNKDSGSVFTTIPIYTKNQLRNVNYLTIKLNYNKSLCPEFYFENISCGSSYKFINASTGIDLDYFWNFGDGDTSSIASPNHFYDSIGNYTVSLLACDSLNCDSLTKKVIVSSNFGPKEPFCSPVYNYSYSANYFSVDYVKIGPDTNWAVISNQESRDYTCDKRTALKVNNSYKIRASGSGTSRPGSSSSYSYFRVHAWIDYNNDGFYSLSERILARNGGTQAETYFTVPNNAVKDIPLRLRLYVFARTSRYPADLISDCNDNLPYGGVLRDYTVILTDSVRKPEANFKDTSLNCGYQVEFTSTSLYNPDTYFWDLGDGNFSSEASLIHTYKKAGIYEVTLIVKNNIGADTISRIITLDTIVNLNIEGKYIPYCPLELSIINDSNLMSINWDFGDGSFSNGSHIFHTYQKGGEYELNISTLDSSNCTVNYKDTLNVLPIVDSVIACDSFTWVNGITYFESNNSATHTFSTDSIGCDSIVTLSLTVNRSSFQRDTFIACDNFTWPLNGLNYDTSGVYRDTIRTIAGCDSAGVLDLTILKSTSNADTIVRCDSYIWPHNSKVYYKGGVYLDTLLNAIGCDSIRILHLTINSTISIDSITTFDSLNWAQNGLTYYKSGLYLDTFINRFGCDSIIALQLKVNSSDAAKISMTASVDSLNLNICDDAASFEVTLKNLGDIDTLFWSFEESNNGKYFDNFENGFKNSLWNLSPYHTNVITDTCGVIFGNSSMRFYGYNRFIDTYKLNTSDVDSIFFSFINNTTCDTSSQGDYLRIELIKNGNFTRIYNLSNIQHLDSVINVGFKLPIQAKANGVRFRIWHVPNFSNYPDVSDIIIDNFRVGGKGGSKFNPFQSTQRNGYVLPQDSQIVSLSIDPETLVKGWQKSALKITSNDSLNQLDSLVLDINLSGIPCARFSNELTDCGDAIQFFDLSKGNPSSWSWDFGDSSFSNMANPIHSYKKPGIYNVIEIACTSFGCDTSSILVNSNLKVKPKEGICKVTRSSWSGAGISNVKLGSINHTSGYRPYKDYTCEQTILDKNQKHAINITTNNSYMSVYVFIDFNNDANFDSSEYVVFSSTDLNHLDTILIPNDVILNEPLRMRVGSRSFGAQNTLNGCNTFNGVQYEDYTVIIQDSLNNPFANFEYEFNDSCNYSLNFRDSSLSYPTNWLWDFGDSSTSLLENPNHTYLDSGTYIIKLKVQNSTGLDSVKYLLRVNDYSSVDSIEVRSCGTYISPSGKYSWSSSGNYTDTLKNIYGCDSLFFIDLIIDPISIDSSIVNICSGDSVLIFGNYQTFTGKYVDTLQSIFGCDSILIIDVHKQPTWLDSSTISICHGDSALIFGSYKHNSGFYTDSLQSIFGCDSIISIELKIDTLISNSTKINICYGDSALILGSFRSSAGLYSDSLQSAFGCDSIVIVELSIDTLLIDSSYLSICKGDSLFVSGSYKNESGIFIDSLQSINGCDSLLFTSLVVDSLDISIQDNSPTLIANANNVNYQWLECLNGYSSLSGDTLKSYTISKNGSYAVEISDGICIDTSSCLQVFNVTLEEINKNEGSFDIIPNPNNGLFTVNLHSSILLNEKLYIFNDKGKLVTQKNIQSMNQVIDLQDLSSGVYILKYKGGTKKIVIIKR